MMNEINSQMATLSQPVQIWLSWMSLIFVASIFFAWKHVEARWAMSAMILSLPGALAVYALWKNVHLFGIVHLVLWLPLLVYLVHRTSSSGAEKYHWTALRIWAILLMATISISLVFDVRDIYLVIEGTKAMH